MRDFIFDLLIGLAMLLQAGGKLLRAIGDRWERAYRRTWLQSFIFAILAGPIVWLLGLGDGNLLWCTVAMAAAPPLVEFLKGGCDGG